MKFKFLSANPFALAYDDYPDAFTPEMWANESIAILLENMVIGNLVHRDFSAQIASHGDVVNTRKPGQFKAVRKSADDNVTVQATTATNVAVRLDQHLHTSFIIKDADQSKAFKDLVVEYLSPGMQSIAQEIDLIVGGQVHQFHANRAGKLGGLSAAVADQYLLETREVLNINKAHTDGRNLILGPRAETVMLQNSNFINADKVGDDGTALREASLGRKYGLNTFAAQNQPYHTATDVVAGAVNNASGYAAGSTAITVDGLSAAIAAGTYVTIAGDMTPLRVISSTGGATPTAIVLNRGLKYAVADNAVVTLYDPGTVNEAAGYDAGYDGAIAYDGVTVAAQVGQVVAFGTYSASQDLYTVIGVGTGTITLDRPLVAAIADGDAVFLGPPGGYNLAFHRNAIALVSRPLALPMPGTGARAGVANWNGMSMRVVITYDGNKQGHLVTVDTLLGVKVLDAALGAVLLS